MKMELWNTIQINLECSVLLNTRPWNRSFNIHTNSVIIIANEMRKLDNWQSVRIKFGEEWDRGKLRRFVGGAQAKF